MFDRPRNWKWMLPAMMALPLLIVWIKAWQEWKWGDWAMMPLGLVIILVIAAVVNLWARVADDWSNFFANVRTAMNATPEVRMFEAARSMHPEAVKALLIHRRTVWRVKYIPLKDVVDWIMDEAPTVHAGFVDFVLDHSNGSVMSKRLLSDGSKSFDPDGIVTDYQQYDDLLKIMQSKLMCTNAYGNQSPQWLPPWNVGLIRHRFGLDGAAYEVDEEISVAMQTVVREQKDEGGRIKPEFLKQLPALDDAQKSRGAEVQKKEIAERPLNDEEMEAVRAEQVRYASKYVDGKVPS